MNDFRPDSDECPTCHQRVLLRRGIHLSPRLADIYDHIERRGDLGEEDEVLLSMFYGACSKKVGLANLKSNIWHINQRMAGICQVGKSAKHEPYRIYEKDEAGKIRVGEGPVRDLRGEVDPRKL